MKGIKSKWHLFFLLALAAGMLTLLACGDTGEAAAESAVKPAEESAHAQAQEMYEIVAIKRVDQMDSHTGRGEYIHWGEDKPERGVLIVLKWTGADSVTYFSTDFSLGYEDEAGIPRSPCIGISAGISTPDVENNATWMLGGFVSRYWADAQKPYIGLLFAAPKDANDFTLYQAAPMAEGLKVEE